MESRGRVYIQKPGYIRIRVYSKDLMLIDKLARCFGQIHVRKDGTRDWTWAKRSEMREYLPTIIELIDSPERKAIFQAVWYWAKAPSDLSLEAVRTVLRLW